MWNEAYLNQVLFLTLGFLLARTASALGAEGFVGNPPLLNSFFLSACPGFRVVYSGAGLGTRSMQKYK